MKIHERIQTLIVILGVMIVLLCSGVSMAQNLGDDHILSVEPTVLRAQSASEAGKFANRAEIYPKEIYFGDTIFFLAYKRNITEYAIEDLKRHAYGVYDEYMHLIVQRVFAEAHYKGQSYQFSCERPSYSAAGGVMWGPAPVVKFTAQPNEEFVVARGFFELPTLLEQDEEFWQTVLHDLETQDSVTVTLKVMYRDLLGISPYGLSVEAPFDITIKARPGTEQTILEQWRGATPWEKVLVGSKKRFITRDTRQGRIPIGSQSYSPWTFIRTGNRKPSDPNNPTNVQGWRDLEKLFQPGVLLDDIVFTRMQLEYYAAEDDNDAEAKRKAFIDWINAKPRPQRAVYLGTVLDGRPFNHGGIEERYNELCDAVYEAYSQMEEEVRKSCETPSK